MYYQTYIGTFAGVNRYRIMRIKEILKEKGLTYQAFADKLGITEQSIKNTLNAKSVTTATLEKFASVLGVEMWEFFATKEEREGTDLTALIYHKGEYYKASSLSELEEIVKKIAPPQERQG